DALRLVVAAGPDPSAAVPVPVPTHPDVAGAGDVDDLDPRGRHRGGRIDLAGGVDEADRPGPGVQDAAGRHDHRRAHQQTYDKDTRKLPHCKPSLGLGSAGSDTSATS